MPNDGRGVTENRGSSLLLNFKGEKFMGIARKCDRCGELYELYEDTKFNNIRLYKDRLVSNVVWVMDYDLCPSCATMLEEWLNVKGEKNGTV